MHLRIAWMVKMKELCMCLCNKWQDKAEINADDSQVRY